jgi:hypothetical protein
MQHPSNDTHSVAAKVPWNKGKMIGARPPLQAKHVWIRTKLQMDGQRRDLALFNLAIDSKLRGCDVVRLRVTSRADRRSCQSPTTQNRTSCEVQADGTDPRRSRCVYQGQSKAPRRLLFESRVRPDHCISTRQYSRLVSSWIAGIGLDPRLFGTHSRSVAPRRR